METKDLEERAYSLGERYKAAYKELKRDRPIPARALKKGMIISGIGAAVAGALLAYQLSDTIESIIKYIF
jgi:hypothetical protein